MKDEVNENPGKVGKLSKWLLGNWELASLAYGKFEGVYEI
jgi:hypothetical protein